jgi:hypothetical protein
MQIPRLVVGQAGVLGVKLKKSQHKIYLFSSQMHLKPNQVSAFV